jgi:hypothetical protein
MAAAELRRLIPLFAFGDVNDDELARATTDFKDSPPRSMSSLVMPPPRPANS